MIKKRKTTRILSTLTVTMLLILLTISCKHNEVIEDAVPFKENPSESEVTTDMEQSVHLIREAGSLDMDSAQGTMETLFELGVCSLKDAELVSKDQGVVLKVIDEESNTYYLGYGGLGYLEIVRKDSLDGEIIYAPME